MPAGKTQASLVCPHPDFRRETQVPVWRGRKSFSSFADYPGLDRVAAFAGLYRAVNRHSPAFGSALTITTANLRTGVLTAEVTPPGSNNQVKLDARVENRGGAMHVTLTEEMTGPILMVNIKGSICKSLNDLVR